MDDRDIDRLLAGTLPNDDPDLAQLANILGAMGDAYPEPSTETVAASHLAAMMETAHLLAENGEPAVRPADNAYGSDVRASGLPKSRRATLKDIWSKKGAKVAMIAFAAVLALGGTAYAGVLPAPIQNVVATAVRGVGITLPHASTTSTLTVPPGYAATHSDDETGTVGEGRGDGNRDKSGTVVPGNNGLHLGWTNGRHLGWAKSQRGQDESGTVEAGQHGPQGQGNSQNQGTYQSSKGASQKTSGARSSTNSGRGRSGMGGSGNRGTSGGRGNGNGGH